MIVYLLTELTEWIIGIPLNRPQRIFNEQTHFTRAFLIRLHIRHPRIVNERNILFLFVNSI